MPWRPSTSTSRVRPPPAARARASAAARVVLPVPPLPVTTWRRAPARESGQRSTPPSSRTPTRPARRWLLTATSVGPCRRDRRPRPEGSVTPGPTAGGDGGRDVAGGGTGSVPVRAEAGGVGGDIYPRQP